MAAAMGLRGFGIFLCVGSWMLAVGLLRSGSDWFAQTAPLRSPEDLALRAIPAALGEALGAIVFFLLGVGILWVFWHEDA